MPGAAYKDLWDTAESGEKWHGYVKNLFKDSSHYWVYATVVPKIKIRRGETVGYTSVRRKPSRSKSHANIGTDQGFCVTRVGYSRKEADILSGAAADFSGFIFRQQQRGWAIESY